GELDGLNLVGLKRRGVARSDIMALRAAFQMLAQGEGTFQERARRLGEESDSEYVQRIVEFVTGQSDRSFMTPGP
ncbi:MAG: acyl-[acyl-carrier-protein]--UDP-N-acetylglucosamine O-acyltransferase, partial [Paracoccaceae bacterium]